MKRFSITKLSLSGSGRQYFPKTYNAPSSLKYLADREIFYLFIFFFLQSLFLTIGKVDQIFFFSKVSFARNLAMLSKLNKATLGIVEFGEKPHSRDNDWHSTDGLVLAIIK